MSIIAMTLKDPDRVDGLGFAAEKTACVAGNTYTVANNGKVLLVANSTAGATLTVITPKTEDTLAVTDRAITLGAGLQVEGLGPWPPDIYNDPATGLMSFTVSANTDVMALRTAT